MREMRSRRRDLCAHIRYALYAIRSRQGSCSQELSSLRSDGCRRPDGDLVVDRITLDLSALLPDVHFVPEKTCIIFDEIQECSGARASIKSFMEEEVVKKNAFCGKIIQ